jgi:SsrA-binding protein
MKQTGIKQIAQNKKARYNYEIISTLEAGLVLTGTEIKSIRMGRVQLQEGYAKIEGGEAFLLDTYIAPYDNAGPFSHDPVRPRKLLLHRKEINRLYGKIKEKGLSLFPLRMYLKNGKAKVELGLGKGKRKYEKRDSLRKEDARKEIQRSLKRM